MTVADEPEEFDTETAWVGRALTALPPARRIAGACRGSGPASAFAWLADGLNVGPADRFVDLGGGLGGPAAWLRARTGVWPAIIEAVPGGLTWAGNLFELRGVLADGGLPFLAGAFSAGWSLATLSTVADPGLALSELHRLLRPAGRLAVQEHVRLSEHVESPPAGNRFFAPDELCGELRAAGFTVVDHQWADQLPPADDAWSADEDAAAAVVDAQHPDDAVLRQAEGTAARFAELEADGTLRSLLLVAERGAWADPGTQGGHDVGRGQF